MNVKEILERIEQEQEGHKKLMQQYMCDLKEHLGFSCDNDPILGFPPVVAPELPLAPKKEKKPFLKIGKKEK